MDTVNIVPRCIRESDKKACILHYICFISLYVNGKGGGGGLFRKCRLLLFLHYEMQIFDAAIPVFSISLIAFLRKSGFMIKKKRGAEFHIAPFFLWEIKRNVIIGNILDALLSYDDEVPNWD